jgi:hypothetical protein
MSNSQVISVNNSVHSLMTAAGAGADVRNNYILIGATWTLNGKAPGLSFGVSPKIFKGFDYPVNVVGASQLFNSTMETYDQGADSTLDQKDNRASLGESCFDCHGGTGSLAMCNLSHIFSAISATHVPN